MCWHTEYLARLQGHKSFRKVWLLQFQEKRGKGCQVFSGLRSAGGSRPGQCFPPNTARSGLREAFPSPPNASGLGGLLEPLQVPGSSYFPVPCRTDFSTKVLLVHSLLPWWRGSRALSSRVGNNSLRGPGGPSHPPCSPLSSLPTLEFCSWAQISMATSLRPGKPSMWPSSRDQVSAKQRNTVSQACAPRDPSEGAAPFVNGPPIPSETGNCEGNSYSSCFSCRRPLTGPFPPPAASLPPKLYSVKP